MLYKAVLTLAVAFLAACQNPTEPPPVAEVTTTDTTVVMAVGQDFPLTVKLSLPGTTVPSLGDTLVVRFSGVSPVTAYYDAWKPHQGAYVEFSQNWRLHANRQGTVSMTFEYARDRSKRVVVQITVM